MATFKLHQGLDPGVKVQAGGDTQVLLVGRWSMIKAAQEANMFDKKLTEKLGPAVDDALLKQVLDKIDSGNGGSMPLYMDLAKITLVSDDVSRYNSPANGYGLYKAVNGTKLAKGVKNMNIVLFTDYASVMASCTAIVRCFPLFSLKTKKENALENVQVDLMLTDGKSLSNADFTFLDTLCAQVRNCAKLVDTPTNIMHTEAFLDEALAQIDALGKPIQKTIIKGKELLDKGFGGIYSVGQAAKHPPLFACFSYQPEGASESYALVGKGIVYDTGGLSLKSRANMAGMKIDMGGAAALLSAFSTLVKANFSQNLHCLLCVAENAISPEATRPDDVITMLSGKSVEVNNTDAEGRLVLADGVFYAKQKLKANTIIDMATLTGAQQHATGVYTCAIVSNCEELEADCVKAGRRSGDLAHPIPFLPELHFSDLSSKVADMKNANLGGYSGPPTAVAALFIGAHMLDFGKPQGDEKGGDGGPRWLHVDIAAPVSGKQFNDRATGFGTALVCALLGRYTDAEVAK